MNGIFLKPQYKVCRESSILYFSAPFFWCSLIFKNISTPRTKKFVNTVVYHLCPSRLTSRVHPSYFFNLVRVVSLSRICWIFSDLYIPPCVGKIFQFTVFIFLENALNLCIFTHAPVSHSKLQVEFFENLFPPRRMGWRKLWFAISKFNQKIWIWLEHYFIYILYDLQFF